MPQSEQPRLVVGISGASGIVYGLRALDACRDLGVETHLVMSRAAALTLRPASSYNLRASMGAMRLRDEAADRSASTAPTCSA